MNDIKVQAALEAIAADAARGEMVFPSHVELAMRVQRLLDDPDCSVEQLGKLISADPFLSARVVGMANAVAYNPSGRTTSDVRNAISRLGFKTLRTLATAVVVRQMQNMPSNPEHRQLAARLWDHTTHVAALARIIAKRVTRQDPETAFFAGIVHEVGSFYLLSRANSFPELLSNDLEAWRGEGEAQIGRAVLKALGVPSVVLEAVEALWEGYLSIPPESMGDTLLLADQLSPVESPLADWEGRSGKGEPVDFDVLIGDEMLKSILADSAEDVASLTAALKA